MWRSVEPGRLSAERLDSGCGLPSRQVELISTRIRVNINAFVEQEVYRVVVT